MFLRLAQVVLIAWVLFTAYWLYYNLSQALASMLPKIVKNVNSFKQQKGKQEALSILVQIDQ
jgi:hypothetical protein